MCTTAVSHDRRQLGRAGEHMTPARPASGRRSAANTALGEPRRALCRLLRRRRHLMLLWESREPGNSRNLGVEQ
jgi:hypothetical protein